MAKDDGKPTEDTALTNKVDAMMNADKPEPVVVKLETAKTDEPAAADDKAKDDLANPDNDKAVADIVAKEGDEILAVEDSKTKKAATGPKRSHEWKAKLKSLLKNKWTWVGVGVVLLIIFALPFTRYKVLGLVLRGTADITVLDSKTGTPVSNAVVKIGGTTGKTDASGEAKFKALVGNHGLSVSKQYYQNYTGSYFVGFGAGPDYKVKVVATGRQIPVTVVNAITGKPVLNAEVKVLKTSAKTDKQGKAIVVVPNKGTTDSATVSATGYTTITVNLQVTDQVVAANTVKLAPAGHVYFLSNLSGTIDVVKTNLDGTGRKVVLAGTGKENSYDVALLASTDWKYLVLESDRDDGKTPALYFINTSDDSVTKFESGNIGVQLIGWAGHDFLYDITNNDKGNIDSGREKIKSYDADHQQTNLLDQNQTDGVPVNYAYQTFSSFNILDNQLDYVTNWYSNAGNGDYYLNGKKSTIRSIGFTGQNKQDLDSFAAGSGYYLLKYYEPNGLYYAINSFVDGSTSYHKIEDGKVTDLNDFTAADFNKTYPTYLLSPSGKQNFWADYRDGKNTLFVGDSEGQNGKQIASLSDYAPYGWYTDNYLLVSKGSSELYIMSATGGQPIKISDYYKVQQTFQGYGKGYGGL